MTDQRPPTASDLPEVALPPAAGLVAREHPELWEAFQRLGEQASQAGPLEARTRRLVHLALAIAAGSEGATHSHSRRALAEGLQPVARTRACGAACHHHDWLEPGSEGADLGADITQPTPPERP